MRTCGGPKNTLHAARSTGSLRAFTPSPRGNAPEHGAGTTGSCRNPRTAWFGNSRPPHARPEARAGPEHRRYFYWEMKRQTCPVHASCSGGSALCRCPGGSTAPLPPPLHTFRKNGGRATSFTAARSGSLGGGDHRPCSPRRDCEGTRPEYYRYATYKQRSHRPTNSSSACSTMNNNSPSAPPILSLNIWIDERKCNEEARRPQGLTCHEPGESYIPLHTCMSIHDNHLAPTYTKIHVPPCEPRFSVRKHLK